MLPYQVTPTHIQTNPPLTFQMSCNIPLPKLELKYPRGINIMLVGVFLPPPPPQTPSSSRFTALNKKGCYNLQKTNSTSAIFLNLYNRKYFYSLLQIQIKKHNSALNHSTASKKCLHYETPIFEENNLHVSNLFYP